MSLFNSNSVRITNKALGEVFSLDVINDGTNNKLKMDTTGDYSGQSWIFKLENPQNVFFRLTNAWQGIGKSLDVVNNGIKNDQLILSTTGKYSGQNWKFIDQ